VAVNLSIADVFGWLGVHSNPVPFLSDIWFVTVAQIGADHAVSLAGIDLVFRPTGLMGTRDT